MTEAEFVRTTDLARLRIVMQTLGQISSDEISTDEYREVTEKIWEWTRALEQKMKVR